MGEEPDLPQCLGYIWNWYQELNRTSGGGFGPAPISWQEIDCWARRTKVEPTVWELKLIIKLDSAHLKYLAEKPKETAGG